MTVRGARMLPNCTANFFRFSTTRLHGGEHPTNPMMTTAAATAAAFFSQRKTNLFQYYYYYSLITLSHSLRLRPLLLHTPTTRSSFLFSRTEGKCPSIWGKFFSINTVGNTANFQISRRRGGSHVTWEVEGVILFLKKSLPPWAKATHILLSLKQNHLSAVSYLFQTFSPSATSVWQEE